MRHVLRLKHMSIRTEKAYVQWAKRFILFHHKRHPADMGAPEIRAFLTQVEYAFQSAIAAVQTAQEDYGRRLASVFASPCFPKSELPEALIGLVKWKQAVEAVTCDCKTLYWLHHCPWAEDEGAIYPGGAIFIKQVTA